jgi:cell wall assembly regulator SMI1
VTWQRLVDALGPDAARLALRPGASEAAIAGAETLFERALPADYRALLAIADGQDPDAFALAERTPSVDIGATLSRDGSISRPVDIAEQPLALFDPDAFLLPIAKVIEQWLYFGKFVVREWEHEPVDDDAVVRPFVFHPTRIPIAVDYLGHGPLLDLWPGPAGTVGQVIQLVSECDFEVLAPSLDDYFTRRAASVAASHRSANRST